MALATTVRALVLALLMVLMGSLVLAQNASAGDNPPEPNQPVGPWIDEIIWSEEADRSKALTEIIAGNRDTIMFDITAPADKQRALASTAIDTFPAFGLYDELSFNPAEMNQTANHPRNPFFFRAVREAFRYLIDRDFVVRDIYGGFAMPYATLFHPRHPDYGRHIVEFFKLEDKYAFNPDQGREQIFSTLLGNRWSIGTSGTCVNAWHDPQGRCVTIKILKRTQDERLQLGGYYGSILRSLNFNVEETGVTGAGIPYGTIPDEYRWHIYTAGWISTAITAWADGQLNFFASCGIGEPYCNPTYYQPPARLKEVSEKLLLAQYTNLTERSALIVEGTDLAMRESLRIFIDARQSLFVNNKRLAGITWDLFGGNSNQWALKTPTVPADTDGVRRARVLNLVMFVDGWNPYIFPGWLYDSVQRRAMIDVGSWPHPHTGRYIDIRNVATNIQTAGPTGKLNIPSGAATFNVTTNTWQPVASGAQATSVVTYDMVFGTWHHGPAITMDDVLYTWANTWRRCMGDVSQVPGVRNACSPATRLYMQQTLKALRVVDSDTLEVYLDYWHADEREIVGTGASFPSAPWEVQELSLKMVLDQVAVTHDADVAATGRIWLDLTKGDSLLAANLPARLAAYKGSNHIAPGMDTGLGGITITAAEATARWAALEAWATAKGNYWPSNGPFYLERVDIANRQTIMKAHRTGYPWDAENWAALRTVGIPTVTFQQPPSFVFAGTEANFDFNVAIGGSPTDEFTSRWLLMDASTREFKAEGIPARMAAGSYRIALTATDTEKLLLGTFEIITVVNSFSAAVPTIERTSFLVTPPSALWIQALLDARARLIEDEVSEMSTNLGKVQSDIQSLSSSLSGLVGLVTAMAILAVIAVVISVVSVMMALRRARGGPKPEPEELTPMAEEEGPPPE